MFEVYEDGSIAVHLNFYQRLIFCQALNEFVSKHQHNDVASDMVRESREMINILNKEYVKEN